MADTKALGKNFQVLVMTCRFPGPRLRYHTHLPIAYTVEHGESLVRLTEPVECDGLYPQPVQHDSPAVPARHRPVAA